MQGYPGLKNGTLTTRPRIPHGCPSHGIALVNNEKELWLSDGINDYIHIFDNTVMPPHEIDAFKTNGGAYWITLGLDGKLRVLVLG